MSSLSRVQLAAALIEYDNDSPYTPEHDRKWAKESAIMSSVRASRPKSQASSRREPSGGHGRPEQSTKPVRRDWTREREIEAAEEEERQRAAQPSPVVQDFRRSSSPFLKDVRPSTPPPAVQAQAHGQPSGSPPATPRQVTVSQPTLVTPKVRSAQRTSISGVLSDLMDAPSVFEVQQTAPPKAHVPPRPHSTQPLNSTSLLESIPLGDPLARPPTLRAAPSSSASLASSPSGWAPAPVALFNVPSFDDLAGIPMASGSASMSSRPSGSTTKRRLSALLMSRPKVVPPPVAQPGAEPIRPLSETLRQSIASLPRSLGGEGPTARSFGARGRTASMGDWESLVLAHTAGDEVGEMGQYAQRVRDLHVAPSTPQEQEVGFARGVTGQDEDGMVEFEGVYGTRPPADTTADQQQQHQSEQTPATTEEVTPKKKQPLAVATQVPVQVEEPIEQLDEGDSRRNSATTKTPESGWSQLSRPSSGYSFLDRVPLDDGAGDLDLPPMFRNDHSGTNTPRSTAGDYNDRAVPFPSTSSRPLSPTAPNTPFRGLDLELGERDERHGPEGGRHTPGGTSLFDEIGRHTPDLLARNDNGEVDRRPSMDGVGRGGPSRMSQVTRASRYDQDHEEALADSDEEMLQEEERWVPPPSKGRASRFDPKSQSISSRMTPVPPGFSDDEDGTDAHRRTSEDNTGRRLPGKPRNKARPTSLAHFGQTHRLATTPTSSIHLPPVLVMPAPLDPNGGNVPLSRSSSRQGFMTTDSKPLPASFTSRPPMVHSRSSSSFVASAAATGVPEKRLTLAQKTFRASLVVDGRRGKEFMGGALEEGERGWELDEDAGLESVAGLNRAESDYRGPGSLYGRSLMEVLEERKSALKSKQRVFTGDARPAMFTRTKSSTSIDNLSQRPVSSHLNPTLPGARASYIEPTEGNPARLNTLLNPGSAERERPGMGKKRSSVFGIDQLWEKETREREEEERGERERAEKRDEAERLQLAVEEERKRAKHEKKLASKRKSRMSIFGTSPSGNTSSALPPMSPNTLAAVETPLPSSPGGTKDQNRISTLPPTLSLLEHSPSAEMAEILHGDSDSDWEARDAERGGDDLGLAKRRRDKGKGKAPRRSGESAGLGIGTWFASSDEDDGDEDDTPRRRTGKGSSGPRKSVASTVKVASESTSSDDEVPLAAQYNLSTGGIGQTRGSSFVSITKPPLSDDSDEERPLAQILAQRGQTASLRAPTIHSTHTVPNPTTGAGDDEDEDDKPLGLRRASSLQGPGGAADDDDVPLGMTQAQHLQQVYMAQQHQMAMMHHQHQQQQQQMMMGGMLGMGGMGYGGQPGFGGMGMGMGGGPMGMMGMQQPMMMQPPQGPRPEEKVDRWRRGVAGES